jgi:hypothetical protein
MPTALNGTLGWTGLHPVQLGGPPLTNTYARTLPPAAAPFIAHAYQNDGVTSLGTFTALTAPTLVWTPANGGMDQVQLMVSTRSITLTQGNVIRLSYQGDGASIVFSGTVEDLPDIIGPGRVQHIILLTAFGFELDDVHSSSVYTGPTDLGQIVRDAVAQTTHCSCDQVSVPAYTGIFAPTSSGGTLDFRNQTLKQQIDTCRSIAGPTWYWFVDELGRVWFQYMGSAARYTLMRGIHYEERTSAASIQDRKNHILAIGGVPTGGSANATGVYDGASQSTIGKRALAPPLAIPNITDQAALDSIAANIGAVLDRVWNRVQLKVLPAIGQRIHGSQPGGAMIRYWEPVIAPFTESEAGTGAYIGPYIAQRVEYDGEHQQLTAGDIPVTNQNDITNMVQTQVSRAAANSVQVTAAALNLQQTLTGSFQSGTGTRTSSGLIATLWQLNQQEFAAIDPNGVTRAEMGNLAANGISPAQWGFRANDASGSPIFDSLGLIKVMTSLGLVDVSSLTFTSTTFADIAGASVAFTIARQANVRIDFTTTGKVSTNNGNVGFVNAQVVGGVSSGNLNYGVVANFAQTSSAWLWAPTLAAGSYTAKLQAAVNATPQTFTVIEAALQVWLLGS